MATEERYKQKGNKRKLSLIFGFLTIVAVLFLGSGTYAWLVSNASIPAPEVSLTVPTTNTLAAPSEALQSAISNNPLPTAVSWSEIDHTFKNDDGIYSLASISKLVAVLVTLDAEPLSDDPSEWPELVITPEDVDRMHDYRAHGGVIYILPPGTVLSQEDVFYLIFLPSDNGIAASYIYSVFGDNESFIAAVDEWTKKHGLTSLSLVEPTGMDGRNVAGLEDLIQLAKIALEEPLLTRFLTTKEIFVPNVGTLTSTNPLIDDYPGILGLKTGRSSDAGFNFMTAATDHIGEREVHRISVTLGRDSVEERASSGIEMLNLLHDSKESLQVVDAGTIVAEITDWSGEKKSIVVADSYAVELLPTEKVETEIVIELPAGDLLNGTAVGEFIVQTPTEEARIPLLFVGDLVEPDLKWKLKNPRELIFSF